MCGGDYRCDAFIVGEKDAGYDTSGDELAVTKVSFAVHTNI